MVFLLSIWKDTTNICSRSAFKCISSSLWSFPGIVPRPLLFSILYLSKIFDIDGRHLPKVNCYAGDSQLYSSINPSCACSQDDAIRSMETCISDVKQWTTSDKLMLNDDNSEFIVIASRHLWKKKTAVSTISVGDCDVSSICSAGFGCVAQ